MCENSKEVVSKLSNHGSWWLDGATIGDQSFSWGYIGKNVLNSSQEQQFLE